MYLLASSLNHNGMYFQVDIKVSPGSHANEESGKSPPLPPKEISPFKLKGVMGIPPFVDLVFNLLCFA